MKRAVLAASAVVILVFGVFSTATATLIHYRDLYDPNPDILMVKGTGTETVRWTFDITDNPWWTTPGQVFGFGEITLSLKDDKDPAAEKATFVFDGGTGLINTDISSAAWSGVFYVDPSQLDDGRIFCTLVATVGDFHFQWAELNVTSTFDAAPVPEPATMLLLGSGLIGLGALGRKRFNRSQM